MRCKYSVKGLLQQHLDVVYMDNQFRSLEAENKNDAVEDEGCQADDTEDSSSNDDTSGVNTIEHMSGKIKNSLLIATCFGIQ